MDEIALNLRAIYQQFNTPVTEFDCGLKCAPFNSNGIPFCCDICHAVPAVYLQEWVYLRQRTDLWSVWRGDECAQEHENPAELRAQTPEHMTLLACKGPAHCQRQFRAISCRQFPFFPYITGKGRFIGLAYEWRYEPTCWVISHLASVTEAFRAEFIRLYDELLGLWDEEFLSYVLLSQEMREHFIAEKRRIPLIHRKGGYYLLDPTNERLQRISADALPRFGPYASEVLGGGFLGR